MVVEVMCSHFCHMQVVTQTDCDTEWDEATQEHDYQMGHWRLARN